MVDVKKFIDLDLYGLVGVEFGAKESEIRKSYRKRALKCHPDKNADNPKAAQLFHELAKALEILTDPAAREAYDKVISARKASEIRNKQLDSKRQKLKADLEERERQANKRSQPYSSGGRTPEEILQFEIERLRKEGSRLLEEEQLLMQQQLQEERVKFMQPKQAENESQRLKVKWKAAKDDETNGGYDEENLKRFLRKYGDIEALALSTKRKGSALVEFKRKDSAKMAIEYEKGLLNNPLSFEWIGGESEKNQSTSGRTGSTITDTDYESLVLRQMRQAEERKRLIEKMKQEDDDS